MGIYTGIVLKWIISNIVPISIVVLVLAAVTSIASTGASIVQNISPVLYPGSRGCSSSNGEGDAQKQIDSMPTDSPDRSRAQADLDAYNAKKTDKQSGSGCFGGAGLPLIKTPGSIIGRINNFVGARSLGTHNGMDLEADIGTPVYSISDGTVIESNGDVYDNNCPDINTCGQPPANKVKVRNTDGNTVLYYHLTHNGNVAKVGDTVTIGQLVAYAGNTGRSTGSHLHLEIRDSLGLRVDPLMYLYNRGLDLDKEYGWSSYLLYDSGQHAVMSDYCATDTHWSWCSRL